MGGLFMAKKRFKSQFTIRKRKHDQHPNAILDSDRTTFSSVTITHSKKDLKRNNKLLISNPNPKDSRKSYFVRRLIRDFKFNYSKAFKNYQLSNEDIDMLISFLESKKKRK